MKYEFIVKPTIPLYLLYHLVPYNPPGELLCTPQQVAYPSIPEIMKRAGKEVKLFEYWGIKEGIRKFDL